MKLFKILAFGGCLIDFAVLGAIFKQKRPDTVKRYRGANYTQKLF